MPVDSEAIYNSSVKNQLTGDFKDSITAGTAVPIHQRDAGVAFWRIPLSAGGRVVGMIDVGDEGKVQRYGLQVKSQSEIVSKPQDILELTPSKIESLAASVVGTQAVAASQPRLVCLDAPTKVAWEVMMKDPQKEQPIAVYVTPGYAWVAKATTGQAE